VAAGVWAFVDLVCVPPVFLGCSCGVRLEGFGWRFFFLFLGRDALRVVGGVARFVRRVGCFFPLLCGGRRVLLGGLLPTAGASSARPLSRGVQPIMGGQIFL